jgi:Tfp pilus assembly PilM family ATPase
MSQHIIAIDHHATGARIAIIEASMRRAMLADVISIAFDPKQTPAQHFEAIRQVLPAGGESVIAGIDASHASTRLLTFPFTDVRKVAAAVEFELEGQIPYALQDVALAWSVTSRHDHKLDVLAAITPRAPLVATLGQLSAAGIEPRAMVLPSVALGEFLPAHAEHPVAIVSLGASESHLAVGTTTLRFVRTLRAGGNDVDAAIARHLETSVAAAKLLKETQGKVLAHGAHKSAAAKLDLAAAIAEGLQPLLSTLLSTFKALPGQQAPKRLLLTGGLSRLPGLPEFLSRHLGLPTQLLDVGAITKTFNVGFAPEGSKGAAPAPAHQGGPEDAIALGMAICLFRHGNESPLNFRRNDLAYHGDLQLYRGQLTRLAVGMAAVFLLAIFASVVRFTMLQGEEKEIDAGFCQATKRIVGREICDPTAALATLRQAPGAEGTAIPSFSASALFEMLSKAVETSADVQFDELDLRVDGNANQPDRLVGKGEAASFESTELLVNMLKRDACVQDAEVSKLQRTQGGRVSFNVLVKVLCPAGVQPGAKVAALTQAPPGAAKTAAQPAHQGPPP